MTFDFSIDHDYKPVCLPSYFLTYMKIIRLNDLFLDMIKKGYKKLVLIVLVQNGYYDVAVPYVSRIGVH
jgi:hypothetical protein